MTDLAARIARAESLLHLRRYEQALETLGPVTDHGDIADVLGLRTQALLGLGDYRAALESANALVAAGPEEEWGHRLCAIALDGLGEHRRSVEAAVTAVRLAPNEAAAHRQLARSAMELRRRRGDARAAAQRAVALDPEDPDSHFVVGLVEQALRNRDAARTAYQRTLGIQPDHSAALNNLAMLDSDAFRPGPEAQGYAAALRHNPSADYARQNLENLAIRFVGVVYVAAIITFVACMSIAMAGPGVDAHVFSPARAGVGVLMLAGVTAYAWNVRRQLPPGVRLHVRSTLLDPKSELGITLVTLLGLAFAGTVAFAPAGPDWLSWLFSPRVIGPLLIALLVTWIGGRRQR